MATEIEHKFLVDTALWHPNNAGTLFRQGFLSSHKERVVRVRVADGQAYLTVKGITTGISRIEFEYAIPLADAATMLDVLCERPIIEKTRYRETHQGQIWEIDVFHGDNDGLVIAELEVQNEAEQFQRPAWATTEVSGDARYFNNNLAKYPYKSWK